MCKHCSDISEVHFSARLQASVGVDLAITDGRDAFLSTEVDAAKLPYMVTDAYACESNAATQPVQVRQCIEAGQGTRCYYCCCEETAVLIIVGLAVLRKPRFPSVRSGWRDHLSMSCIDPGLITALENYM